MGLRPAILCRITVGWLVGFIIAVAPLVLPWQDDGLIPSASILLVAAELALPLLLIGGTCCLMWPRSVASFPFYWAAGTLVVTWLYLFSIDGNFSIPSPWIGALAATAIFSAWTRYHSLLPIQG